MAEDALVKHGAVAAVRTRHSLSVLYADAFVQAVCRDVLVSSSSNKCTAGHMHARQTWKRVQPASYPALSQLLVQELLSTIGAVAAKRSNHLQFPGGSSAEAAAMGNQGAPAGDGLLQGCGQLLGRRIVSLGKPAIIRQAEQSSPRSAPRRSWERRPVNYGLSPASHGLYDAGTIDVGVAAWTARDAWRSWTSHGHCRKRALELCRGHERAA
jgi:hypothetical protein